MPFFSLSEVMYGRCVQWILALQSFDDGSVEQDFTTLIFSDDLLKLDIDPETGVYNGISNRVGSGDDRELIRLRVELQAGDLVKFPNRVIDAAQGIHKEGIVQSAVPIAVEIVRRHESQATSHYMYRVMHSQGSKQWLALKKLLDEQLKLPFLYTTFGSRTYGAYWNKTDFDIVILIPYTYSSKYYEDRNLSYLRRGKKVDMGLRILWRIYHQLKRFAQLSNRGNKRGKKNRCSPEILKLTALRKPDQHKYTIEFKMRVKDPHVEGPVNVDLTFAIGEPDNGLEEVFKDNEHLFKTAASTKQDRVGLKRSKRKTLGSFDVVYEWLVITQKWLDAATDDVEKQDHCYRELCKLFLEGDYFDTERLTTVVAKLHQPTQQTLEVCRSMRICADLYERVLDKFAVNASARAVINSNDKPKNTNFFCLNSIMKLLSIMSEFFFTTSMSKNTIFINKEGEDEKPKTIHLTLLVLAYLREFFSAVLAQSDKIGNYYCVDGIKMFADESKSWSPICGPGTVFDVSGGVFAEHKQCCYPDSDMMSLPPLNPEAIVKFLSPLLWQGPSLVPHSLKRFNVQTLVGICLHFLAFSDWDMFQWFPFLENDLISSRVETMSSGTILPSGAVTIRKLRKMTIFKDTVYNIWEEKLTEGFARWYESFLEKSGEKCDSPDLDAIKDAVFEKWYSAQWRESDNKTGAAFENGILSIDVLVEQIFGGSSLETGYSKSMEKPTGMSSTECSSTVVRTGFGAWNLDLAMFLLTELSTNKHFDNLEDLSETQAVIRKLCQIPGQVDTTESKSSECVNRCTINPKHNDFTNNVTRSQVVRMRRACISGWKLWLSCNDMREFMEHLGRVRGGKSDMLGLSMVTLPSGKGDNNDYDNDDDSSFCSGVEGDSVVESVIHGPNILFGVDSWLTRARELEETITINTSI